jgi:hypothetical protein
MDIPKKIKDELWEYCRINNISNVDDFILRMIRQGFTAEKYGSTPMGGTEVEKIVEVIKEVFIEKEIPVEKIVTKIEYISDKDSEDKLVDKIGGLEENIFQLKLKIEEERQIFSTKTKEMENNFQHELSKKDKELDIVKKSIEEEKKNQNKKDDIYSDERKGGFYGSNLLNK